MERWFKEVYEGCIEEALRVFFKKGMEIYGYWICRTNLDWDTMKEYKLPFSNATPMQCLAFNRERGGERETKIPRKCIVPILTILVRHPAPPHLSPINLRPVHMNQSPNSPHKTRVKEPTSSPLQPPSSPPPPPPYP